MRGFRILVVEDEPQPLKQTLLLLEEAIPGSKIESAESIQGAIRLIERAVKAGDHYDLAILDFKLPQEIGEHDSIDESVCQFLGDRMPSTVIGHMSGWLADPQILAHIARDHEGRSLGFILDKRHPGFGVQLITKARQALHGARIERRIGELFDSETEPQPDGPSVRLAAPRMAGSASNRLMELSFEIAEAWKYLSPTTRATVRKFFVVKTNGVVSVVKR